MTSDPYSPDFNYKKYSLKQLDNWINDALTCEDLTAQDIYDTVVKCVDDAVEYHKKELSKSTKLLSLLKGHSSSNFVNFNTTQNDWNDFWEESYYPEQCKELSVENIMPPWGHSDMEALRYTEEELNAMCDKAELDQKKEKEREYNLREAEYYNKRAQLDAEIEAIKKAGGYEWTPENSRVNSN